MLPLEGACYPMDGACGPKSCWALFTQPATWQAARDRCQDLGKNFGGSGDLVAPDTAGLHNDLVKWLRNDMKVAEVWIGLKTDYMVYVSIKPEDWYWVDTHKTPSYDAWPKPDAKGVRAYPSIAYQNCVSLVTASATWQNNMCAGARPYVCNIKYGADSMQFKKRRP